MPVDRCQRRLVIVVESVLGCDSNFISDQDPPPFARERRPEYRDGGAYRCDIDFEDRQYHCNRPVPCRIVGRVCGCLVIDDCLQSPDSYANNQKPHQYQSDDAPSLSRTSMLVEEQRQGDSQDQEIEQEVDGGMAFVGAHKLGCDIRSVPVASHYLWVVPEIRDGYAGHPGDDGIREPPHGSEYDAGQYQSVHPRVPGVDFEVLEQEGELDECCRAVVGSISNVEGLKVEGDLCLCEQEEMLAHSSISDSQTDGNGASRACELVALMSVQVMPRASRVMARQRGLPDIDRRRDHQCQEP